MNKFLTFIFLITLYSCSIIQIGSVTDLYNQDSMVVNDIEYKSITNLNLNELDSFQFFYIVNFDCDKNIYAKLPSNAHSFYLVENSVINLKDFTIKLTEKTDHKTFYYLPFKESKNPNKNFEYFIEELKNHFTIKQDGYMIEAYKKL